MSRPPAFFLVVLLLIVGCSDKKAVKPAEADHADAILASVRSVFEAYDSGSMGAFANLWASAEDGRAAESFPGTAVHEYSVRIIETDHDAARVSLTWNCRWKQAAREKAESGTAVFMLGGSPPRLVRIEGDSPFVPPF